MELFGHPKGKREVETLPLCGSIGCQESAKYYAPSKHGIWVNMCEKCSRELSTGQFHTGFELIETITPNIIFDGIELVPVAVIAMHGRDRLVKCGVCSTKHKVDEHFSGVIECRGCTIYVRVMKLYPEEQK